MQFSLLLPAHATPPVLWEKLLASGLFLCDLWLLDEKDTFKFRAAGFINIFLSLADA